MILGITVLVLLSALISGAGVNLGAEHFPSAIGLFLLAPILFVAGTLIIGIGVAPIFFSLDSMKKIVLPITAVGIGLSVLAYYLYSPSFVPALMLIPVALTLPGWYSLCNIKKDR